MEKISWLEKLMRKYRSLTSEKSINTKSVIKISNNKHEKKYPFLENKILSFSDLFMTLSHREEAILGLWYINKIPKKEIAKKCKISKSTLYRIRKNIAVKLYYYRHIVE